MTPAHVSNGNRRYRYYTCTAAQKHGWRSCPSKSLPAAALERFVLEQVAPHARDGPPGSTPWQALAPQDQARRLRAVVARIDYDGTHHQIAITLRPSAPAGIAPGDRAEDTP
jgi:hypothetical protein